MSRLGAAFLAVMLLFSAIGLAYAQIGEVAGTLDFVVAAGSSQTLNLTLINVENQSLNVSVSQIFAGNAIPNTITPMASVYPMNGTIPANSSLKLKVTVQMPNQSYSPNARWKGYVSVIIPAPASGGASIEAGVLKVIMIKERAPPPAIEVSPNPTVVPYANSSTVTATCANTNDTCAIQFLTLGNTVATGTGTVAYKPGANLSIGSYAFYANDLSQNVNSVAATMHILPAVDNVPGPTGNIVTYSIGAAIVVVAAVVAAFLLKKRK
ncbi:MAG: hypothetical protein KGH98_00150 [Candidatus Micrarchaeota archaeon]|nr:hypothetical protein [Candidatus Micrarchaeota archaeon]